MIIVHPRFRPAWATIQRVPDNYFVVYAEGTLYGVNKRETMGSIRDRLLVPWFISPLDFI